MERRSQGLRRTLGCLALLVASLSVHLAVWFESESAALVALWVSLIAVVAIALLMARAEPLVGRVICRVIAGVAGVQLVIIAVDALFLDDPTGLTSVVWMFLLSTTTAFLTVVLFVAQPAVTTRR